MPTANERAIDQKHSQDYLYMYTNTYLQHDHQKP